MYSLNFLSLIIEIAIFAIRSVISKRIFIIIYAHPLFYVSGGGTGDNLIYRKTNPPVSKNNVQILFN